VIITALTLVVLISVGAFFLHSAYQGIADSDSAVPPEIFSDGIAAFFDEQKVRHLTRCQLFISEAMRAASKRKYDDVHSSFESAVDEMSAAVGKDSPLTCFILTMQVSEEKVYEKWPEVERLERRILKSLPKTKPYKRMLADNRNILVEALEQEGKYEECLQWLKEAVATAEKEDVSPDKRDLKQSLNALSNFYRMFQVYDKAFETAEIILAMDQKQPPTVDYYLNRVDWLLSDEADIKRRAHDFPSALRLYNKAIAIAPEYTSYYSERGIMQKADLHNFAAAVDDYTKAIDLGNANMSEQKDNGRSARTSTAFYYFRRGLAYLELKDYDLAMTDLDTAIENGHNYFFYYARKADIESKMGKIDKALLDFGKAFAAIRKRETMHGYKSKNAGEEASIYMLRGDAFYRASRYDEALADYEQCLLKAPSDVRSFCNRAAVFEQLGQHKKALDDYARAEQCLAQYAPKHCLKGTIENMPEWKERLAVEVYVGRAKVYDSLKQKKLADADRAKVKQLEKIMDAILKPFAPAVKQTQ